MMRLIDADKIKYTEYVNGDITVSKEEIDKQPTVKSVVIVKQTKNVTKQVKSIEAEWEFPDMYDWGWPCSNCGEDCFSIFGDKKPKFKYCPHCGAKMRG